MFIRQDEQRTKLQERIEAQLREKSKQQAQIDPATPDGVNDSNYLKDTKQTTSLAWVWVVIVVFVIVAFVVYVVGSAN